VQASDNGGGGGLFVGSFEHLLDGKRRLTIPAVWREIVGLPASVYVIRSAHFPCLAAYPARELLPRLQKLRQLSMADRRARLHARTLGSQSDFVPWDAQGRVRIGDSLLTGAGVGERVVLLGALDCFEIWNPDRLRKAGSRGRGPLGEAVRYLGF
jgi:MraZ protein